MNEFKPAPVKPLISVDDFAKVDIRVGTIQEVHDVESSKKLVRLEVFFGDQFGDQASEESRDAEDETESVRVDRMALLSYEGRYLSPELETVYTVLAGDSTLTLRHRRVDPIVMSPTGADRFASASYPVSTISFERDASNRVVSFVAGNGRVLNMRFVRME